MARYRSRSRSYSPRRRSRSPRVRGRKRYDDEPRRSYGDRRSPGPSGLLVRNLPLDARPEDLRIPFERYGPVKDVYLPKNYYTGEPRGFGFVKFRYGEDATEAKQRLNHTLIGGREIKIVFAEENRKTPQEMRLMVDMEEAIGGHHQDPPDADIVLTPAHLQRGMAQASNDDIDTSFLAGKKDHRDRDDYRSPRRSRSVSRSPSPRDERDYRSNQRSPSPRENGRSFHDERNYAPSPSMSPRGNGRSPSRGSESGEFRKLVKATRLLGGLSEQNLLEPCVAMMLEWNLNLILLPNDTSLEKDVWGSQGWKSLLIAGQVLVPQGAVRVVAG
ncbi:hypothetical protein Patl1_25533 [Pistacia atlantica]|uniref:Uncharacterized protein n=1 Tax=Pistacia atlantica TaxID=434234 RepID=A0ACC1B311_9ROSI|nr:hypothetical protein Patl1_25533 [Pistacia atlantica]